MKPIVISMGDPAGIGPEVGLKGLAAAPEEAAGCVVLGDLAALRRAKAILAPAPLALAELGAIEEVQRLPPRCLGVLQACDLPELPAWGQVSGQAGRAAAQCIAAGAQAVLAGQARALVTAPIHKEALAASASPWAGFPGHTELLQHEAARFLGCSPEQLPVRMMLAGSGLRTVLVSIHVSLRQALDALSTDRVLQTVRIAHGALERWLGRAPRLAVAGLNPHAGEGGLFGREEIDILAPAVAQARQAGIDASGPHAPDTVFMRARQGEFDAVIALYHDQGLIPVKLLGLADGVNVTLGLPLLRTSPDHGTAFDLAGTGRADPSSFMAALRLAHQLSAAPAP